MTRTANTMPKGHERYGNSSVSESSGLEAVNRARTSAQHGSERLLGLLDRQFVAFADRHGVSFDDARLLCMHCVGL